MKEKTKTVNVTYSFRVRYEHEDHLKSILKDLERAPIFEMGGAGMIGNESYGYSCKLVGKGVVQE